jgi:hypothetical protein
MQERAARKQALAQRRKERPVPLTTKQRRAIEEEFLNTSAWEAFGLESHLARRLGVPQSTIHRIKAGLYRKRLFFSQRYAGFVGVTEDGRLFRVERGAWEQSVEDGVRIDRLSREGSEEINHDPANWEPCIDENPGVRLIERATRPWKKPAPSPIPLRFQSI